MQSYAVPRRTEGGKRQRSEVRSQTSDVRRQTSRRGGCYTGIKMKAGMIKTEVRGQKGKSKGLRSEDKNAGIRTNTGMLG